MADPDNLRATGDRIAALLDQLQSSTDRLVGARALEAMQLVTELYGAALARVVELADPALLRQLAADDLVASLLVVHGLHPDTLAARVGAALEQVRPYLGSHGGDVELLGVEDGRVQLRMLGSCDGCPSSSVTLKLAVEQAILAAAPEVEGIDVDGIDGHANAAHDGATPDRQRDAAPGVAVRLGPKPADRVGNSMSGAPPSGGEDRVGAGNGISGAPPSGREDRIGAGNGTPGAAKPGRLPKPGRGPDATGPDTDAGAWAAVDGLASLPAGRVRVLELGGQPLVVCRVGAALYAYQDACPVCRSGLATATLTGEVLRCGACGAAYDVRLAGRSLDGTPAHLDPRPLLEDEGGVRIATATGALR